jgi:tetratricopeptide (TPR) repeat protein
MRWLGLTLAVVMALSPAAWAQTRPATTKPAPSQPAAAADDVAAALRAREFAQAAERSQAALKQSPKDPRLWTLNGLALAGLGKRAEALRSFQRALASDPNNLAALEGAAQAHYEAGSQRAVPLLQRILKQRPDDPTAHAMLAVLAYRGGDCRAAVRISRGRARCSRRSSTPCRRTRPAWCACATDLAFFKKTPLPKGMDFQIRFEFYNIFNRRNPFLQSDLSSPGFGKAISQQLPRWWQFGARFTF